MKRKRMKGFCRAELVVVCFCVALLLSVTVPALTSARSAGKRAVCLANLKTLGAGMRLYAQDHEDKIPCWGWEFDDINKWFDPTDYQLQKAFELGYIWEYVQTRAAFVCPALRARHNPYLWQTNPLHKPLVYGWPNPEEPDRPSFMWSYSVNGQPGMSQNDEQCRANPELVQPSSASVMMLFEQDYMDHSAFASSVHLFNALNDYTLGAYHLVSGSVVENDIQRKTGFGNLVYFDGHVESMRRSDFMQKCSTPEGILELWGGNLNYTWPGF